jgi:membrane-associated protease RseP (regulator of RpoE activity)
VEPRDVVLWIACVFLSILVHEFGHGLMARLFGFQPYIALYWMGGLCASEGERQTPGQRAAVLIAGPGAGFLLAGASILGWLALGAADVAVGHVGAEAIGMLLFINIAWGIVNLFPIYPLDGGQLTGVLLTKVSPRNGMRWTLTISLVTAGILAIAGYMWTHSWFFPLLFGSIALGNYQSLQVMHHYARYGGFDNDDDADWWKR